MPSRRSLIALVLLAVTACQSPVQPSPTASSEILTSPVATTQESIQPSQTADEAREAVTNALLALATQPNRMQVTTLLEDGTTYTNTIEFVSPDRKHILDDTSGMEYIIIGNTVYMKSSAQSPWEQTEIPASTFMGDQLSDAQAIGATLSEVRVLGSDHLQSTAVTIYAYNSHSTVNGVELDSKSELWVGTQDGLPYLLVVEGEVLAASTNPATGESSVKAVSSSSTTNITLFPDLLIENPLTGEDA